MKARPWGTLSGPLLIESTRFKDDRGWFQEVFRASQAQALGLPPFVQENHSRSAKGVVRGLHHQLPPRAQGKLVRCASGRAFDVAVDLRRGSPTFGQHVSTTLDAAVPVAAWIPPGFAHGFQALDDGTDVVYLTTSEYDAALDRVIRWDDPAIGIRWPLAPGPVSPKDAQAPSLAKAELPEGL